MRSSVPIAITGMASHFPGAESLYEFWQSIENKKDSITDNIEAEGYWKKSDFYEPDTKNKDKTYAYKAGWIPPIAFDPVAFKLPPAMVESISSAQLFSLHVAKQAFRDAGMFGDNCSVDREKVGVILGGAGNGNTSFMLAARQQAPILKEIMINSGLPEYLVDDIITRLLDQYLEWNEDSFPGFLGNVACGRIASFFDLGGTSNMVDAACASSLAAMKAAIGELVSGSCDAVLTGGVNLENSIFSFLCFSRTPALSPSNKSRPFDTKSDGMMLGDGVGMLVLKRLEDAENAGDRIYAVINSLAGASDGRAKSIFAPRKEGQVLAIRRAYDAAGITAKDIGLVEAHGTGTAAGDQTELKSLNAVFAESGVEPKSVAIGSIKSQIGHTRCAAGAASTIKVALGLHHKVYPATINVDQPNKTLSDENSIFYVNTDNRPWIQPENAGPRRGVVSAFGFGGTNYHLVLEEYNAEQTGPYRLDQAAQVVVLHKDSPQQLLDLCKVSLEAMTGPHREHAFVKLIQDQVGSRLGPDEARVGFAAKNADQARNLLETTIAQLEKRSETPWEHPLGIYYRPFATPKNGKGRVVALFPGQGSQHVNMGCKVANAYPEMRRAVAAMDGSRRGYGLQAISGLVYPIPSFSDEVAQANLAILTQTENAQPAIGALSVGYLHILKKHGFTPDFVAGHSFGELTALLAADVIDQQQFNSLAISRGEAMKSMAGDDDEHDTGAMLAVNLSLDEVHAFINSYDDISLANINSPTQIVLGGASNQINALHTDLSSKNIRCAILPVSAAFHTRFVAHAAEPFSDALASMQFKQPTCPVYSNVSGQQHEANGEAIKALVAEQLTSAVRFVDIIENIYQAGGTHFVEIGPKNILGKLVGEILGDREHTVVSLDTGQSADDGETLKKALAKLIVAGVEIQGQDPYALLPEIEKSDAKLTYTINGGYYFSETSQKRRSFGRRKDSSVVDRFVAESIAQWREKNNENYVFRSEVNELASGKNASDVAVVESEKPIEDIWLSMMFLDESPNCEEREGFMAEENKSTNGHAPGLLGKQINAQNGVNTVHQQFQENQKEYVAFLNAVMQRQFEVFDKHGESKNFKEMISSINHSLQLLEKNQTCYHLNHEKYFLNQQFLLGGAAVASDLSESIGSTIGGVVENESPTHSNGNGQWVANGHDASQNALADAHTGYSTEQVVSSPEPRLPEMAPPVPQIAEPSAGYQLEEKQYTSSDAAMVSISAEDQQTLTKLEAVDADALAQELVRVISEKTGYPEDMIGLDMDLEADLGIDSIKRIEIIGAMFDSFGSELMPNTGDAEEYSEMDTIDVDEFSTVSKMVAYFMDQIQEYIDSIKSGVSVAKMVDEAVMANSDSENSNDKSPSSSDEVDSDVADVMATMGFVTSSRELEYPKRNPVADSKDLRLATGETTINEDTATDSASRVNRESTANEQHFAESPRINRYVAIAKQLADPDFQEITLPEGFVFLIADEDADLARAVALQLQSRGVPVVRLCLKPKSSEQWIETIPQVVLEQCDEAAISAALTLIRESQGLIGGLLYLQEASPAYKSIKSCFNKKDYVSVESAFLLAKHTEADLLKAATAGKAMFYCCSQLDGHLGTGLERTYSAVSSGLSGLVKSLNYEWSGVQCRAVDLKPKMDINCAAKCVMDELSDPCCHILEVGRASNEERITLTLCCQPTTESSEASGDISDSDVFVVSGGGRGITAECVKALAAAYKTRFILLGRTAVEEDLPEWAKSCGSDIDALRSAAIDHLRSQDEQLTPVKIDKILNPILQAAEVRKNLAAINAVGARAVYVTCNILDKKDVQEKIRSAEKSLGKVTGFIHGAGTLADKKIEKKTLEDFQNVFLTKIKGLENIVACVPPESLKHLVIFSSVSGFFGNAGQTDYASANEALNKFAYLIHHLHPTLRVKTLNWGPWDSGMVNETLKKAYMERGVAIIPQHCGADLFVHEFKADSNIQVIFGSANYTRTGRLPDGARSAMRYTRRLSANHNMFVYDHVIDGKPVLPATCALSWIIDSALYYAPNFSVRDVTQFRVTKGVVFDETVSEEYTVDVATVEGESTQKKPVLNVIISSELHGKKLQRYSAVVHLTDERSPVDLGRIDIDHVMEVDLGSRRIYGDAQQPGWLFHGSNFSGLRDIRALDSKGGTALCELARFDASRLGLFACENFNPYIADVALQVPYLWMVLNTHLAGLPAYIGSVKQVEPLHFDKEYVIRTSITENTASKITCSVYVADLDGQILLSIEELQITCSKALREKLIDKRVAEPTV